MVDHRIKSFVPSTTHSSGKTVGSSFLDRIEYSESETEKSKNETVILELIAFNEYQLSAFVLPVTKGSKTMIGCPRPPSVLLAEAMIVF